MKSASSPSSKSAPRARESTLRNAAQWWEPRRVVYNLVLALVFVALAARTWPRLKPELSIAAVFPLTFLILLANIGYSAAYVLDMPLQHASESRTRLRWRRSLWVAGTLLAVLAETYWFLDEILPPIG